MLGFVMRWGAAGLLLCALLLAGMRALGAALPSSGEIRYLHEPGIWIAIPYAIDIDRGVRVQMLPTLHGSEGFWTHGGRYVVWRAIDSGTCFADWQTGQEVCIAWRPTLSRSRPVSDGTQIIYDAVEASSRHQRIYRAAPPDFAPEMLTPLDAHNYYNPTLSPDGRQIAFDCRGTDVSTLCLMNLDGSGFRRLVDEDMFAFGMLWSTDSRYVALRAFPDDDWNLTLVEVATGAVRLLTPNIANFSPWGWSADSARIAVITEVDGAYQIEVFALDGTHQAWPSPYDVHYSITWSANGRYLLVRSARFNGSRTVMFYEFWDVATQQAVHRIEDLYNTAWSPDGHTLAYGTETGELCFLRLEGWQTRCTPLSNWRLMSPLWLP
ncbi:MAG: PD40 domain-containing protein [Chloroflexi bacterium]|nr:PD40 domain-containing protein [Chloroflexota bacterium]